MAADLIVAEIRPVFIYGLHAGDGDIRYIGQCIDPEGRLREHLYPCNLRGETPKVRWLRSVLESGGMPQLVVLEQTDSRAWRTAEQRHIAGARAAGWRLTNIRSGGDGILGWKPRPDTLAKIAAKATGRKRSAESRAKQAAAQLGRRASDAARQAISRSLQGRVMTQEARAKMAAAKAGRQLSDEHKAKLSAAHRGKPFTAEHRANLAASMRATKAAQRAQRELSHER